MPGRQKKQERHAFFRDCFDKRMEKCYSNDGLRKNSSVNQNASKARLSGAFTARAVPDVRAGYTKSGKCSTY